MARLSTLLAGRQSAPLRIALVCPYAWDRPGGVQTHIAGLARALTRREHEVKVLAPLVERLPTRESPTEPDIDVVPAGRALGVPFNGSVAPISFGPAARRAIKSTWDSWRPEVVHLHEPAAPSVALLALLQNQAPLIGTFHASGRSSALVKVGSPIVRRVLRRLQARVAVSEAARSFARGNFGGEYRIVPNGIDRSAFADAAPLDLGPGPHVLFLGRLEARKGLEVLIRALPALKDLGAQLIVAGTGPEERRARDLAAALSVPARFFGPLDDATKASLFAAADIYCAPNLGGESFGIVLIEAMAAGTPVVCSDLPGFREAAGEAALFTPPGWPGPLAGALRKVLLDGRERARLRRAGARRAAELDWDQVVGHLESLYIEAHGA